MPVTTGGFGDIVLHHKDRSQLSESHYSQGEKKQYKKIRKKKYFGVRITWFQISAVALTICIVLNLVVTIFFSAKLIGMPTLKGCDEDTRKFVLLNSIRNIMSIL